MDIDRFVNNLHFLLKNGLRTQPPSWLELTATRTKSPIFLQITLMDGSVRQIEVDSSSTASEVVLQIAKSVGISDPFGFAIFIKLYDKVNYDHSLNPRADDDVANIFHHNIGHVTWMWPRARNGCNFKL